MQFSHTPLPPDWQVSIPRTQLRLLRIFEMLRARPESERACGLWRERQPKKLSERQTPPPFLREGGYTPPFLREGGYS